MKILIATPLYPPDVAASAKYVKEVATRLSKNNKVTVLAYSHLPEKIPGVEIRKVNKNQRLFFRLFSYTKSLIKELGRNDILYGQNGTSVELPIILASLFLKRPLIIAISDKGFENRSKNVWLFPSIRKIITRKSAALIREIPEERPEILPFDNSDYDKKLELYEKSWQGHMKKLEEILKHA